MLLDKYLIDNLNVLGVKIMKKSGLDAAPKNFNEMIKFFETLKKEAENNDNVSANMIYKVLYNFVSSVEVRDRHTSPRFFEDIFAAVFDTYGTDTQRRDNPVSTSEIKKYDIFTKNEDWDISADLSGNKREKADVRIGEYAISLKTLKGVQINENRKLVDKSFNDEINVGSFSYRALFKGVLSDGELALLSDRKGGLGSKKQIRKNVLDPIKKSGKSKELLERLKLFFSYVYEEDLLILIKSDYQIKLHFIPNKTFVDVICLLYEKDEANFQDVWGRWENNNLRFGLTSLLKYIGKYKLIYKEIVLNLDVFKKNKSLNTFSDSISQHIKSELTKLSYE